MARVLVVEDDEPIRELMALALEETGHTVEAVADGRTAVAAAVAAPPDLIVLDYLLPHLDGRQVVECLTDAALGRIPVILCTALSPRDIDPATLPAGVVPFYKPFDLTEFLGLVDRLGEETGSPAAVVSVVPSA